MKYTLLLQVLFIALVAGEAPAHASVVEFLRDLYLEFKVEYAELRQADYDEFCHSNDLDPEHSENARVFFEVEFFHQLLTGAGAADGIRGGYLGIPYFWHWIEPNPRHEIVLLPDSVLLSTLPPPVTYERYKSYADLDRLPTLYLYDLVSEAPRYSHPLCGAFFSFGWCSEREMAYVVLMRAFGYQGKVKQSGIHTWSVLWCSLRHVEGYNVILEVHVDNTFDQVYWEDILPDARLADWSQDIGHGTEINWYNRIVQSDSQLAGLAECTVFEGARKRLRSKVRSGLRGLGQ